MYTIVVKLVCVCLALYREKARNEWLGLSGDLMIGN